jgi:hypothetical protein
MHQHSSILSLLLNELERLIESSPDVFVKVVLDLEVEMLDVWGKLERRTPYRYYCCYAIESESF